MLSTIRHKGARRALSPISRQVLDEHLTYLSVSKLRTLERLVKRIDKDKVPGVTVECGIALGGSAIMLTELADRPFRGYDVFGMIPPPTESDPPEVHERYLTIVSGKSSGIKGDQYYGYMPDLYEHVCASFEAHGLPMDGERVRLVKGLFEDTLEPTEPVALAHVDCDWFDPVTLCLERLWPAVSPGGFVVLDDYNDYGGCRDATDAFLALHEDADLTQHTPNAVLRKSGEHAWITQ